MFRLASVTKLGCFTFLAGMIIGIVFTHTFNLISKQFKIYTFSNFYSVLDNSHRHSLIMSGPDKVISFSDQLDHIDEGEVAVL